MNEKNAFQMAADTVRDAKAATKIATQAASGNIVGAAITTIRNPELVKKVVCIFLAFNLLVVGCLFAIPSMLWEAAESVVSTVSAGAEDAAEAAENRIYYVFYGSSDGHEGLTGILTALNREYNPFSIISNVVAAGWEYLTDGQVSAGTEAGLPIVFQDMLDTLYLSETGKEAYANEALAAGGASSLTSDGEESSDPALNVAFNMKMKATRFRINGRYKDLDRYINKDAEKQRTNYGCNTVQVDSVQKPDETYVARLALALYSVQTGSSLDNVTLAEYCNWLGVSKESIFNILPGVGDAYLYKPALLDGEKYESDETGGWATSIYHWGGELLPQDVYDQFQLLYQAALKVEEKKDKHFTSNDKYDVITKVMHGKYKMDDEYHYPSYCTEDAYSTDFSKVWYNKDQDTAYDRGALDVLLMPSAKIKQHIETYTIKVGKITVQRTRLHLTYKINTLEMESAGEDGEQWWTTTAQRIMNDVLKMPQLPDNAVIEKKDDSTEQNNSSSAEYVIQPRAVMLNKPTDPKSESYSTGLELLLKDDLIGNQWSMKWARDLMDSMVDMFGNGGGALGGGDGSDLVSVALGEEGVAEIGSTNNVKYNTWYYGHEVSGEDYPWCAVFVSWCAEQCGYLSSGLFRKTAYSGDFWDYVLAHPEAGALYLPSDVKNGKVTPQAGDIIIFDSGGSASSTSVSSSASSGNQTDHVGIVFDYDTSSGGISTIEGNCSNRVQKLINEHNISDGNIWGFVRPNYPSKGNDINDSSAFVKKVNGLAIDTDGASVKADIVDGTHAPDTSYHPDDDANASIDASTVNYIVAPLSSEWDKYGKCLATVKDNQTGKVIYCIVGDRGPAWGEVSVQAGRNLGYAVDGNHGIDPDKSFTIKVYPNCKLQIFKNGKTSIQDQINAQGAAYASKFVSDKKNTDKTDKNDKPDQSGNNSSDNKYSWD